MKNLFKFYRIGWTNEGFLWRKGNYCILKPKNSKKNIDWLAVWKFRKVGGQGGMQLLEFENNFTNEQDAFDWGNHVIKNLKRNEKVNKKNKKQSGKGKK